MYGLATKVLQKGIIDRYGDDTWEIIHEKSGVKEPMFVQMTNYPDAMTFKIVEAACEVLNETPERVLFLFAEYWILLAEKDYADLVSFAGKDLVEVLNGINDIHARASFIFPDMKPPSFECTDVSDESFRVHYKSVREGLAPFVEGLITGLGKRLSTKIDITHDKRKSDGEEHDQFVVTYVND
ncbi:MAG: heme NO-binding protein [Gammaproteobacteria bacterium]|nr:heme NO-binding protein [Gammaproteobacteria bacterium]